jgi:hypothetical protein
MATKVANTMQPQSAKVIEKPKPEAPMSKVVAASPRLTVDDIRMCAYFRWETAGKPPGDGVIFWLEAERELFQAQRKP